MLTFEELRKSNTQTRQKELTEAKKNLYKAQFSVRTTTTKEIHKIRQLKKYIARILTIEKTETPKKTS